MNISTPETVSTHGHTIMHWLAAEPMSIDALRDRVHREIGAAARFHTCDTKDLRLDGLLALLAERGKISEAQGLWTSDLAKSCSHD